MNHNANNDLRVIWSGRLKNDCQSIYCFRAKINKYGDRVLDTIECTIREYQKASKNSISSGSNENADAMKRRRESIGINSNGHDDDFAESSAQFKKRAPKSGTNQTAAPDTMSISTSFQRCIDVDLDGCDEEAEETISKANQKGSGRVLPQWSKPGGKGRNGCADNLFKDYVFKK